MALDTVSLSDQAAPRRFRIASTAIDPVTESPATVGYTVKGLLGGGGTVSVLAGDSNVGKTALALAIGEAVAKGEPLGGCRTRRGSVVIVAAEAPGSVHARIHAVRDRLAEAAPIRVLPGHADLSDRVWVDELIAYLCADPEFAEDPVRLVVIDVLASAKGDADENSTDDMTLVMQAAERVAREAGVHVMINHHYSKAGAPRGSTAIRAACSTLLALEEIGKDEGHPLVLVRCDKQRDLPKSTEVTYRIGALSLGVDEDGDEITVACATVLDPAEAKSKAEAHCARSPGSKPARASLDAAEVLAILTAAGRALTAKAILDLCGPDHPLRYKRTEESAIKGIRTALSALVDAGKVRSEEGNRYLAPKGAE